MKEEDHIKVKGKLNFNFANLWMVIMLCQEEGVLPRAAPRVFFIFFEYIILYTGRGECLGFFLDFYVGTLLWLCATFLCSLY